MNTNPPTVAVTGAAGYLGSRICTRFESLDHPVVRLVRRPDSVDGPARPFDLAQPMPDGLLASVDILVHAAYDFGLTSRADIWRVNVGGTRRLLTAAREAGVGRIVALSTMSAYEGTGQRYGQAKLSVEQAVLAAGGSVLRPGLVYGDDAGGMVGALRKLVRLPLTPVVGGRARQFPVHEDDLVDAVVALALSPTVFGEPVGAAQREPVEFREFLRQLADAEGSSPRFVPLPWQALYAALRVGELLPVSLPFRADSLLGLVRPASSVPAPEILAGLGVTIRSLPESSRS